MGAMRVDTLQDRLVCFVLHGQAGTVSDITGVK
jgi:hypothetical protein